MTLDISHLVVNGCSLTFCQGLERPEVDGWPALLAKKLNVPVINLALPGSGNDGIHRRTYDYFYKSQEFYQNNNVSAKPFYINALTFAGRREEFFKKYYGYNDGNRHYCLDLTPDYDKITNIIDNHKTDSESIAAYVEYGYLLNFDLETSHISKLHLWSSLINLFKSNNINYAIADYIPTYDEKVNHVVKTRFRALHSFVYNNNYIGDFAALTEDYPKLSCGHDGLQAQQFLCNYIYNKLLVQYQHINAVPIDQLFTLKEFYSIQPMNGLALGSPWY